MRYILLFIVLSLNSLIQAQTTNTTCANAQQICLDNPVTYPANTNSPAAETGPAYGCLGSRPNPAWFFLQVSIEGAITISITNSQNRDLDYIIYGPFENLSNVCGSLTADVIAACSFAGGPTETANFNVQGIDNYYILLVTNYSNQPTDVTFTKTAGTGAFNCTAQVPCFLSNITANPGTCQPSTNSFTLNGQISISNPPSTGNVTISTFAGSPIVLNAPFISPIAYSFPNLPSDGQQHTVNVEFSANNACSGTKNYTAPASCLPCDLLVEGSGFYCIGEELQLEAVSTQGISFAWSGPANFTSSQSTISIPNIGIQNSGIYTVIVSGENCVTSQPFLVEIADVPTPQAVDVGLEVCEGQPLFLSAQIINFVDYTWTGPNGFTSNIRNIQILPATPQNSGWYYVSVTQNGCPGRPDSVLVQVNPTPSFSIIGPNETHPSDPALITLEANDDFTYIWTITGNTVIIDTLIYSETNDSLQIIWNPATGTITVRIRAIDELGCISPIISHSILVDYLTDNQSVEAIPGSVIYPNPVQNELHFKPSADLFTPIEIFDITGKRVWSCNSCTSPIDPHVLSKGIYTIRYKHRQQWVQSQFIKN